MEVVEVYNVGLNNFNEFSFSIRVIYHIKRLEEKNYIQTQNQINLEILKHLSAQNIKFPTRIINNN